MRSSYNIDTGYPARARLEPRAHEVIGAQRSLSPHGSDAGACFKAMIGKWHYCAVVVAS